MLNMSLANYYEQISREPLLSKEDELDLFLTMQDKGLSEKERVAARERVIKANLRYVFKEAKNYSRNDPSLFEELIAAGNEGLLVALEKYKPAKGNKFLTYAGWWVKQRILIHMAKQRIVALPIWRQQLSARIQKFIESREDVNFEDLKKEFSDIPEKDLRELFQTRFLTFYIEDFEDDSSFEINPIEDTVHANLDREKLHAAVAKLPPKQKQVIELLFGLLDGEERKATEVAKELGLTRDELKEHKREGLKALKLQFGDTNPFE